MDQWAPSLLDAKGCFLILVVVQFPIADARRFVDAAQNYLERPSWKSPQVGVVSDYVWGFGPVVQRFAQVDAAWTDEAYFAQAGGGIRFPQLVQRQVQLASGATPAIVTCAFRRLFHDGACVARVEIGFEVEPGVTSREALDATAVVNYLLALPSIVPESGGAARPRQLALQGSHLAQRYRDASTPRSLRATPALVATGNPVVLVDTTDDDPHVTLPKRLKDATAATSGCVQLGFVLTPFGRASIPTWYLGPEDKGDWDMLRNLRICLLRLHAEEEVLDRVMSWIDSGRLPYIAESDAAGRLDAYIDKATKLLQGEFKYGLAHSAIRDAYDAVTRVNRSDVTAQRHAAFDAMRLQVRRKAEAFVARRDAVRPQITVEGDLVNEKIEVKAKTIQGSQIGHDNAQIISDSFNKFDKAHNKHDDLRDQMKIISESVAALVAELQAQDLNAAKEVTETFQSFAEESAKEEPKTGTLRVLGQALIDAGKKVAGVAVVLAPAIAAVMQIFGVPVL